MTTKKMLTAALIQCHYDYASAYWFSSITQKSRSKIQANQNRSVRLILGLKSRTHLTYNHFSNANIIPLSKRVDLLKLCHMYKVHNQSAPSYLVEDFQMQSHRHNTRYNNQAYVIPQVKSVGQQTFRYTVINLWNNLPSITKMAKSYQGFKKSVKKFIWINLEKEEKSIYKY